MNRGLLIVALLLGGCTRPAVLRYAPPPAPLAHSVGASVEVAAAQRDPLPVSAVVSAVPLRGLGAYARGGLALGDSALSDSGVRTPAGYSRTWSGEAGIITAVPLGADLFATAAFGAGARIVRAGAVLELDDGTSCFGYTIRCVEYPYTAEGTARTLSAEVGFAETAGPDERTIRVGLRLTRALYRDVVLSGEAFESEAGEALRLEPFETLDVDVFASVEVPIVRDGFIFVHAVGTSRYNALPEATEIEGVSALANHGALYVGGRLRLWRGPAGR